MKDQRVDEFSDDQDQYTKQQNMIIQLILKFKQKRAPKIQKQIKGLFFQYQSLLQQNYASPQKWLWLKRQKNQVQVLKNQKATQNQQQNTTNFLTIQDVAQIGSNNNVIMNKMTQNIQTAIQYSTYIRVELDKQIQALDAVQTVNKDTKARIERSIKGLRTMLRRIMLSKVTRCLSVITVLAIIALIVVYILKSNGFVNF